MSRLCFSERISIMITYDDIKAKRDTLKKHKENMFKQSGRQRSS